MSFYSELIVSGEKFRVLNVAYNFNKPQDQYGKPNGVPDGGLLILVIESKSNASPIKWMLSYDTVKAGELNFMRRDSSAVMRKIKFENAHCVSLSESFSDDSDLPMTISFVLSCAKMDIDGNIYDKSVFWGEKDGGKKAGNSQSGNQQSSNGVNSFIPD